MDVVRQAYLDLHPRLWPSLLAYWGDRERAEQAELAAFAQAADAEAEAVDESLLWRAAFQPRSDHRSQDRGGVVMVDPDGPPTEAAVRRLEELDDDQRAVVVLRFIAGLELEEIAPLMSRPFDSVEADHRKACAHLQGPAQGASADEIESSIADLIAPFHDIKPPDLWPDIVGRGRSHRWAGGLPGGGRTLAFALSAAVALAGLLWLAAPPPEGAESADPPSSIPVRPATTSPTSRPTLGGPAVAGGEYLTPVAGENGAAIYDLRLPSGERFRLSVPARLHTEIDTVVAQAPPAALRIVGPTGTDLRIRFTPCPGDIADRTNRNGSLVGRDESNGAIRFCRPDEPLTTDVTTDLQLSDAELDAFDLRPVALGPAYIEHRRRLGYPADTSGPLVVGSVVVTTDDAHRVLAVDAVNLTEQWTFELPAESNGTLLLLDPTATMFDEPMLEQGEVAAGVWLADSDRGIVNLASATGAVRWRLDLPGVVVGVRGQGQGPWYVWSSFAGEGDQRPPELYRVDPGLGTVLWRAEGRRQADWGWNPITTTDDQVVMVDVFSDPDSTADGQGTMVFGFDAISGERDFAVGLDGPEGTWTDQWLARTITTDDGPSILSLTPHGLLTRIDAPEGNVVWSARINPAVVFGLARLADGSLALRTLVSPAGRYHVDWETGRRLQGVEFSPPPPDCDTAYGPTAWAALWQRKDATVDQESGEATVAERSPGCLVVAEHQTLEIWNKGFDTMELTWLDRRATVDSDEELDLGLVGRALPIGPTQFAVDPYADLTVWVVAEEASATFGLRRSDESFGPISVGMALPEASAALGPDSRLIAVEPGPGACVAVEGDPYSPLFRLVDSQDGPVIAGIGPRGGLGVDDTGSFC